MRNLHIMVLAVALAGALPSAHAQDRAAQERAAKLACLTGDPTTGARILAELFIDTQNPTYLYNQGRCYEQNSRFEDAIKSFREYLRKGKNIAPADRADTEQHITDCQALLVKTDSPAAPAPSLAPAKPAPVPPVESPPTTEVENQTVEGTSERPGLTLRATGIVLASVGVSATIAGLVFNLRYNNTIGDMQTHYRSSTESNNKTKKTLAIAGYGVGAACLAGGVLVYYLGWRAGRTSIVPTDGNGNVGLTIAGAF